jgi:hypothetical protein
MLHFVLRVADRDDGNSLEIFTPRGIEESRNGNLPFLEDRGTKESIPRGPWGISRNGMIFHSTHFSGFTGIFGIIICIITENTNLWDKNSIMIKKFQCLGGFFFSLKFFLWNFSRKCCAFWYF